MEDTLLELYVSMRRPGGEERQDGSPVRREHSCSYAGECMHPGSPGVRVKAG
jgi:hypothetical protein